MGQEIKASGLSSKPMKHWDAYRNSSSPAVGLEHPRSRSARKLSFGLGIVSRVEQCKSKYLLVCIIGRKPHVAAFQRSTPPCLVLQLQRPSPLPLQPQAPWLALDPSWPMRQVYQSPQPIPWHPLSTRLSQVLSASTKLAQRQLFRIKVRTPSM